VLGDGPAISAEAIRRVAVAAEGATGLVSARYGDRNGHPVAIPRALWSQLPSEGEEGARALGKPAVLVDCSDLPAPGDADTPAELAES
jgi:CTP:molybdopterin cytidylyltransferase MocA